MRCAVPIPSCPAMQSSAMADERPAGRPSAARDRPLRVAIGDSHRRSFTVTRERCISNLVAELPSIMGTYALVEWMEIAAYLCIADGLGRHQLSVAESIEVQHFRAVGQGAEVHVDAVVRQVLGHRVWFDIRAHAGGREVGASSHVRAVVPRRLLDRAADRAAAGTAAGPGGS
jgi:predicted thioesterase